MEERWNESFGEHILILVYNVFIEDFRGTVAYVDGIINLVYTEWLELPQFKSNPLFLENAEDYCVVCSFAEKNAVIGLR